MEVNQKFNRHHIQSGHSGSPLHSGEGIDGASHTPLPQRIFESDLPWGEIPVELQYDRQTETSELSNGVSVTTIDYKSPIVTLSVFIRCGSINEKEAASGVAHFLEHMHFKGTQKRTKRQLETEIEDNGAHLNAFTTRDYTSYILNVFEDKVEWAVEFLADILTNSVYVQGLIDMERGTIKTELLECQKEEFETVLENSHMTAFLGHSIARPILGLVENIASVTRKQILEFHELNYTGENILLVAAGNVEHQKLTGIVDKYFKKLPKSKPILDAEILANQKAPTFQPRVSFIDGPEGSVKVGCYWEAPTVFDPDYVTFLILQRLIGDYEPIGFELSEKQTSLSDIRTFLTRDPRIRNFKSGFVPYAQAALFGCFIEGEPEAGPAMAAFVPAFIRDLRHNLKEADVLKIRSNLLSELMMIENGNDLTQDLGFYLAYLKRPVGKSEMAKRISLAANPEHIRRVLDKWIGNRPYAMTIWGSRETTAFGERYIKNK
jgi:predicted Zn-dependent peptidase